MATSFVWDEIYTYHEMGYLHPESPRRLLAIKELLDGDGVGCELSRLEARDATFEELTLIHDENHVKRIEGTDGMDIVHLDPDTSTNRFTWKAAVKAVGGGIVCTDAVFEGKSKNSFAFLRPPGHHAEKRYAKGFCIFNNIAIAAEHLIKNRGVGRVGIIDFDVHHGNGTQNSFYARNDVFFTSTHRYPFFPGSGAAEEKGSGAGLGFTFNIPLESGADDDDFLRAYDKVFSRLDKFKPEIILVSAGYDAHQGDPLGGMKVTDEGYEKLMTMIIDFAGSVCDGKIVMFLEGGYDLKALRNSIEKQLEVMATA
jgi:acetoin utilization deacetylase AcuC-like enzyme